MSIANAITDAVTNLEKSGQIQILIEKHLASAMNDIVESLFGYREPIREAIKNAIKDSLSFDPHKIALPNYQTFLGTAMQSALEKAMFQSGIEKTEEIISGIIGKFDGAPINLSQLVEMVKESDWIDDDEEHEMSCHIEQSGSFTHVYLDFNENQRKYECRVNFTIYDGKISNVNIKNADNVSSKGVLNLGHADKIQSVLTRAFATGHPVTVDVTDPDQLDLGIRGENVEARRC